MYIKKNYPKFTEMRIKEIEAQIAALQKELNELKKELPPKEDQWTTRWVNTFTRDGNGYKDN